jgi:hypothetical protein
MNERSHVITRAHTLLQRGPSAHPTINYKYVDRTLQAAADLGNGAGSCATWAPPPPRRCVASASRRRRGTHAWSSWLLHTTQGISARQLVERFRLDGASALGISGAPGGLGWTQPLRRHRPVRAATYHRALPC